MIVMRRRVPRTRLVQRVREPAHRGIALVRACSLPERIEARHIGILGFAVSVSNEINDSVVTRSAPQAIRLLPRRAEASLQIFEQEFDFFLFVLAARMRTAQRRTVSGGEDDD